MTIDSKTKTFAEWAINVSPNRGAQKLGMTAKQFRALQTALTAAIVVAKLRAEGKPWEVMDAKCRQALAQLPREIQHAMAVAD